MKRTVLIVEDEQVVRSVAQEVLQKAGFDVLTASDGVEGVRIFEEHAQDIVCVLLDITMPRKGGEAAFREIRRVREDTQVIFSSGYNEENISERVGDQRSVRFIKKPYSPADLVEELRSALTT